MNPVIFDTLSTHFSFNILTHNFDLKLINKIYILQVKIEQEAAMRRLDEERTRLLKELVVAEKRGEERETGKLCLLSFSMIETSVGLTTL